jgi:hypothetical protein
MERDRKAIRLRARGMAYADVVVECGYTNDVAARKAVSRFLMRENKTAIEEHRGLHRERIETLMRALWLAAINPGVARQAARQAGEPEPPDQIKAIETLHKLLDQLAKIEGTYAPARAEVSGPDGGPIAGRVDVLHWSPDEAFMTQYARVLREAGLLDAEEPEVKLVGPGAGDPELASD